MKATPLLITWHEEASPIYSAHFEPNGKGRLATAGGDNNVRLWKVDADGEERKVEYLSTLSKHSQSVNVVRWAPKGELLASAGDDGVVLLWIPSEMHYAHTFGEESTEEKESWRVKHMCRSSGAEIYDLAWSPDAVYFIIGSMDNIGRIYNAQTGQLVRQIAEHNHYVQGVAWDPLNEYVATQSSDRSVHIYSLRTKDGHFTLDQDSTRARVANHAKTDLPSRRISSHSPAPPDLSIRSQSSIESALAMGSPAPSAPGTPTTLALPMNPPSVMSRRSSFGSSPSMRRSASPAPSLPLPAVMPMEASPKPYSSLAVRNANLYANETLPSFFRRLTFTPDGSLLLTPAGQYQSQFVGPGDGSKTSLEIINTVYIYTRGGINKPPIAHLPGHKKPSVVVKCSPKYYTIRKAPLPTQQITIDTSSADGSMPSLPEPAVSGKASPTPSVMDPPPLVPLDSTSGLALNSKKLDVETSAPTSGAAMAFSLPYRMVYAVATQDSVLLYDTQQQSPLCVVSNLHCATFTDLTWSTDGLTLLMTSSDGFCSTLTFTSDELGQEYVFEPAKHIQTPSLSASSTPNPTPTSSITPVFPNTGNSVNHHHHRSLSNPMSAASPPPAIPSIGHPSSPTRSNSASSITTQASFIPQPWTIVSNPPLKGGNVPSITAGTSNFAPGLPMTTPPQTPGHGSRASSVSGVKRDASAASESEKEDGSEQVPGHANKKRRVATTTVADVSR